MHECPLCGQACDCDMEDVWHENVIDCAHECEDWDSIYDDDSEDIDDPSPDENGEPAGVQADSPVPVSTTPVNLDGDFARIGDPDRADSFHQCGIDPDWVPIRSIVPTWVELPGLGRQLAYIMRVRELSPEQQGKLADFIASRFGEPREGLVALLLEEGVPIPAENVSACSTQPYKYL